MRRKVLQIAESTQLISLPRKWCLAHNIKKGDELEIEEQGNRLVVSTEKTPGLGAIEVNVTDLDRDSLMYLIRCLYIKGYDEIKVRFDKPLADHYRIGKKVKVITSIHEEVNRLNGVEIIQQRENFCIIKDIAESSMKDFDVVLRRIFLLVLDASSDLLQGTKKGDMYLIDSLKEKHDTITKFIANNLRLLNKEWQGEKNNLIMYHILYTLDNITDILKESSRYIVEFNVKFSKETENFLRIIHTMLSDFQSIFFKFDLSLVEKISRNRYDTIKNLKNIAKRLDYREVILLTKIKGIADRILDLSVNKMVMQY